MKIEYQKKLINLLLYSFELEIIPVLYLGCIHVLLMLCFFDESS